MSQEFQIFAKAWGFQHTVSSPYNSRSNGKVELAVKIARVVQEKHRSLFGIFGVAQ